MHPASTRAEGARVSRGVWFWLLIAAALSACGGGDPADAGARLICPTCPADAAASGGAGSAGGTGSGSIEGYWTGTSAPYDFGAVVLPDGQTYVVYTRLGVVEGLMVGKTGASASEFTGSITDFNATLRTVTGGILTGQYVASSTLTATALIGSTERSFSAKFDSTYLTAVDLTSLAGSWSGTGASRDGFTTGTLQIAADGTFSGSTPLCTVFGQLEPVTAGKHPLRTTATFSGARCPLAGKTVVGVAVVSEASGRRQILTAGIAADQSDGFFGLLAKQ